jgi:hypothetical protein
MLMQGTSSEGMQTKATKSEKYSESTKELAGSVLSQSQQE